MVLRNVTASPAAFGAMPTTAPPGVPQDTLAQGFVTQPPWGLSGPFFLVADANRNHPTLDLGYSTDPLFRAVPLPARSAYAMIRPNVTVNPIYLLMARLTFAGLGPAPLGPEKGVAMSALPLWALGLAPGEPDAAKRCASAWWVYAGSMRSLGAGMQEKSGQRVRQG